MIGHPRETRQPTPGRFVRELDAAIACMIEQRPMSGRLLEVEVRGRRGAGARSNGRHPDIAILWQREVPLAARLGRSVLVRTGAEPHARTAIQAAARAKGLALTTMGERQLWTMLGVPR